MEQYKNEQFVDRMTVLDEEELFYMSAAQRDARKVAASRIGLHNKDILLESFLTAWELPFQALKITPSAEDFSK